MAQAAKRSSAGRSSAGRSSAGRSRAGRNSAGPPRTRIGLLRGAAALLFVLIAGWAIVAVSAAALFREANPALVLRLTPADARAKVREAEQDIASTKGQRVPARARELSREALRRDPTIVGAWRTLALVEAVAGRQDAASGLFQTAQRLSRRDAVTQLWLIEENVRRNDIVGALRHYDIALRSSKSTVEILLPRLVQAAADPAIADPLTKILAAEPPWAYHFYNYLVGGGTTGAAASALIGRLPPEVRMKHLDTLRRVIALAVEKKEYEAARQTYLRLSGASPDELLRNGDFEGASAFPPLEWQLTETSDLQAEQATAPDAREQTALRVTASSGAVGTVASQLLLLRPGSYRLSTVTEPGAPPAPEWIRWQVRCEGAAAMLLSIDVAPRRAGSNKFEGSFQVPASGCRAQWIRLEVAAPEGSSDAGTWVHRVAIQAGRDSGRG